MKTPALMALFLASSTISGLAVADSACLPYDPCREVVVDAGACRNADSTCGGDAGTCAYVGVGCPDYQSVLQCLRPPPPQPADWCASDGGCSIAGDPSRMAKHAALPSFLLAVGAVALLVDRQRRKRMDA